MIPEGGKSLADCNIENDPVIALHGNVRLFFGVTPAENKV
jgi:hypothetical protein